MIDIIFRYTIMEIDLHFNSIRKAVLQPPCIHSIHIGVSNLLNSFGGRFVHIHTNIIHIGIIHNNISNTKTLFKSVQIY